MPRKQSNAVTSTTITVHVPMTFPVYGGHKAIISEIVCAPGEKPGRLPERSKAPAPAVQSPPQRTENALLKALARAHRCALSRSALGQFPDPAATSQEPADGPIRPSNCSAGLEFCQSRLACTGSFGHRFKKFRLSHRLALPGRVNLPSPRFWRMPFVFDSEAVINGAEG
jgi:hypothetical protein